MSKNLKKMKEAAEEFYQDNFIYIIIQRAVFRFVDAKINLEYVRELAVNSKNSDDFFKYDDQAKVYGEEYLELSRELDQLQIDLKINIKITNKERGNITFEIQNY